jgi:DNA-binding response OmpR family regulator
VRLLLIEDNPPDVLLMRDAVRRSSIAADVVIAYDGEQALHLLEQSAFDLVVLDLGLPKFDGQTILKKHWCPNGPPLVVFTGSENPQDRKLALELGVADYVTKPLRYDDFSRAVQDILERYSGKPRVPKSTGCGG